ncbi:uncharacterized protein PRCAT00002317001 [Priceomyces carsonii]|uniref:uncharacterized protein n=1 Tax=Priceomyces carsonii TaxID=28549 RepID=UPI002ED7EAFC|nr:unnamed protein product [Priceomyces carsonii]
MKRKQITVFKWVVTSAAIILNLFIYFYPDILNSTQQCAWHKFEDSTRLKSRYQWINRLPENISDKLLLNIPSLLDNDEKYSKSAYQENGHIKDIQMLTFGDPQINGNWPLTPYIKRLDNYGNDYYLGHIYNVMSKRMRPSHVAVMGDLFSSQWILDSEFFNRTYRYVERLFPRPLEYKKNVVDTFLKHENYDWQRFLREENEMDPDVRFESRVNYDVYDWLHENVSIPNFEVPLFINLTGNHDIGYSGDATWQHMCRFHQLFGQNNYVINYNKGKPEEWRLVVLDSLTLEGPALQSEFINFTWSFLEKLQEKQNPNFKGATVLLTHIPFYKEEGLCKDGPEHKYYITNEREPYKVGKLRSQNHLSNETTQKVLDILFPNKDQPGVILTGHDHEGCNSWYNYQDGEWLAAKQKLSSERQPVREIVVRSMMGDFGGQTGIFTGHYDYHKKHWMFDFSYCSFVVQHWWWAAKIVSAVAILLQSIGYIFEW